jgi:hypothetical protein
MTVMTSNTLRESAIEYAQRSILVFPLHYVRDGVIRCSCGDPECTNSGKHPRTANGLLDGTRDVTQLCEWWDALPKSNVGLCTGAESGFIVLDVDPRHGGHVTLAALEEKHGKLPDTATTVTGSSGNHRLFKHPGRKVPNDAGLKLGAGLDIRGDGGYIVAPPSNHLLGQYGWKSGLSLDDVELAPLPEWLAMLIVEAPKPKQVVRVESRRYLDAPGSGRYWLEKALDAGGDRNNRGMWMMAQMRDAGMSKADCIPFVGTGQKRQRQSHHPEDRQQGEGDRGARRGRRSYGIASVLCRCARREDRQRAVPVEGHYRIDPGTSARIHNDAVWRPWHWENVLDAPVPAVLVRQ